LLAFHSCRAAPKSERSCNARIPPSPLCGEGLGVRHKKAQIIRPRRQTALASSLKKAAALPSIAPVDSHGQQFRQKSKRFARAARARFRMAGWAEAAHWPNVGPHFQDRLETTYGRGLGDGRAFGEASRTAIRRLRGCRVGFVDRECAMGARRAERRGRMDSSCCRSSRSGW
jgi:hypothetical protein